MKTYFLLFCLFFCGYFSARAQTDTTGRGDTTEIVILNINQMHGIQRVGQAVTELLGDVQMRQGKTFFWCDTGYILPNKQIDAHGSVQISPQGDSIDIFSDSLFYDGMVRKARLRKNVVLQDKTATIFTDLLYYDLNTRIAEYPKGVLIVSDSTQLVSKRGNYNANTNIAFFADSVRTTNPNFKLIADSLQFNTKTEVVRFLSPTLIYDKDRVIYCERGYYDERNKKGVFAQNAYYLNRSENKSEKATGDSIIYDGKSKQYYIVGNATFRDDEQEVSADSIYYDEATEQYYFRGNPVFKSRDSTQTQQIQAGNSYFDKAKGSMVFTDGVVVTDKSQKLTSDSLIYNKDKKEGYAIGHAVFRDTAQNTAIQGGIIYYNDSSKTVTAYKNPVFTSLIDGDTTWLTADTLHSVAVTDSIAKDSTLQDSTNSEASEVRHIKAYHDVRIFKNNLQALADSLFYDGRDSIFQLFGQPVLWADSVQFTGDTILMKMQDSKMKKVSLLNNALIINCKDGIFYDQIKGRYLYAYLDSSKIQAVEVLSSGEAIYYVQDGENKYIGVNRVECANMLINFGDNQIQKIRFYKEPKAAMTSMGKTDHNAMRLKGFLWREAQRPKTQFEIIERRPLLKLGE
jgi:lipopolysaccharide export system protein LptA